MVANTWRYNADGCPGGGTFLVRPCCTSRPVDIHLQQYGGCICERACECVCVYIGARVFVRVRACVSVYVCASMRRYARGEDRGT